MRKQTALVAVAAGLMAIAMVGCGGGGDDSGSTSGGTAGTGSSAAPVSGGATNASSLLNVPIYNDSLPEVLLDWSTDVNSTVQFDFKTATHDGTMTVTVTWTAKNGGAAVDIPLEFIVNNGQLFNPGTHSPFSAATPVVIGKQRSLVIVNNAAGSVATVHIKVVWTTGLTG